MKVKAKPQWEDLHTQEEQLNPEMVSFFVFSFKSGSVILHCFFTAQNLQIFIQCFA